MSENSWDGTERRVHPRFGIKSSSVKYRKAGLLRFLNAFSPRYLIINISLGGLYFITKEKLAPGTRLELVIEAPLAAVPITASGRVVWGKKSADFEAWRVGVQFTKLGDRSRKLLRHVLDNTVIKKVDISTSIYLKEIERL
jgi:hypothetical protein